MKKITFLGDIVCDKPMLKAALKGQSYDFDSMLAPLQEALRASVLMNAKRKLRK